MDGSIPRIPGGAARRRTRRRFLQLLGQLAGTGSIGMLLACQSPPETIVVTPPPAGGAQVPGAPAAPTMVPTAGATAAPASLPVAAQPTATAAAPVRTTPPIAGAAASGGSASATSTPPPAPVTLHAPPKVVDGRAMYQANAWHTGQSPHTGPTRPIQLRTFDTAHPSLALLDPGDPRPEIQSSAAVAPDGTIFIGNFPGGLYALRDSNTEATLDMAWRFHPPGASSFHATPALGPDGTVYVGFSTGGATPEARGTFYAIAGAPGEPARARWSVDLGPGRQTSSPTLGEDGRIYVVSGAGMLFALTPDGDVTWTAKVGPTLKTSPALAADGTVYIASMDGKLYAVAPPSSNGQNEGTIRWTFEFARHPGRTPAVTAAVPPPGADGVGSGASPTIAPDGTIYIGANNSNFYAVGPDGQLKWLFEAEREVAGIWSTAALSLDGGTLFFGANKGGMYALDRESGSLRWQFPIYGSVYSSPTLDSQGVLYTGSTIGHVLALRSDTGELVWDFDANAPVWTAPALRPDGSLVIADTRGRVMVLGNG